MNMDWENRYQTGNTPWDKGHASPPLLNWLDGSTLAGRVLVPGCGSGHDVRAIAAHGAEVVGLDVAPSAIKQARSIPAVADEIYREADLFHLPPEFHGAFDWVFEHTCFCAIPPARREDYVTAVHSALRPGGQLLAIFYLNPDQNHPDDGPPFGVTREELITFFADRFHWLEESIPSRAFAGREGRELLAVLEKR